MAVALVFMALAWQVGPAQSQRLNNGSLACSATPPSGGQSMSQALLSNLTNTQVMDPLNTAWGTEAPKKIDPLTPTIPQIKIGCINPELNTYCTFNVNGGNCYDVYADVSMDNVQNLSQLQFKALTVTSFNLKDAAAHSNRGPDASRITSGVFAPDGHSSTDPAYAIVLPHIGANGALVIDLGTNYAICGNGYDCIGEPIIQADNDDVYELDYSSDNMNWTKYGQFPTTSGSGLHTRSFNCNTRPDLSTPCSASNHGPNFSARYVRVWAVSGGNTFAVSQLKFWDTSSRLLSVGKSAVGPRPWQITNNGGAAHDGTSSTDTQYSVVLNHVTGSTPALYVDLGSVMTICGNGWDCLSEPIIQADNDDVYQFDYSIDGTNWVSYGYLDPNGTTWHGQFPSVGGSGLATRNLNCSARPNPDDPCSSTNHGPNFKARYVRVYAASGGNTFAVSELWLYDIASNLVSIGAPTYGPEPFVTDGQFAPEGTEWNDSNYATVLPVCPGSNSNSTCVTSLAAGNVPARSAPVQIDLGASFPIHHVQLQADQDDLYEVDYSADGNSWTLLWVAPSVSGHGLTTRTSPTFAPSPNARYLRVYNPPINAGDGSYSVSGLRVFTTNANTACAYDGGANAGENFACSYDGGYSADLVVPATDPISPGMLVKFYLDSAAIKVVCSLDVAGIVTYTTATYQSASNRNCSIGLSAAASPALQKNAFCSGFCASGTSSAFLSYAQTEVDVAAGDTVFTADANSLTCDGGSMDSSIPGLLEGVMPAVAGGAVTGLLNGILNNQNKYTNTSYLVPFPPNPGMCASNGTEPPPPTPAPDNLSGLAGSAVGVGGKTGTLHITGRFTVTAPIALDQAAFTLDALLDDRSSGGDLVRGPDGGQALPVGLQPQNGSKPDKGLYQSPPGTFPIVHATIDPVKGSASQMAFSIDVNRASIKGATQCASGAALTPLTTSFILGGGSLPPLRIHATQDWQCSGNQLKTP
ncbi:MAG TPA: hypothetical protein VGK44_09010 [Casimicrobiaceae bacterium]